MKAIEVRSGDCVDVLRELDEDSIDMIAAARLGRRCLGIELRSDMAQAATKRLKKRKAIVKKKAFPKKKRKPK